MWVDRNAGDILLSQSFIDGFRSSEESRVGEGHRPWPEYDSSFENHEYFFNNITPSGGILRILDELMGENFGQRLSILDVAGQGNAYLEMIDSRIGNITAVSLGDYRSPDRINMETSLGLRYIPGDILTTETREEICTLIYDFVVFKPEGARHFVTSPAIGFDLLDFLYKSLNQSGVILMEVPEYMLETQGTNWVNELANIKGIEVKFSNPLPDHPGRLLLRKKVGGPESIESVLYGCSKSRNRIKEFNTLTWY